MHRLARPSGDQVRFVRSPAPADIDAARLAEAEQTRKDPRAALGAHTDYGSVTLLHNRLGGLQILPAGHAFSGRGDEKGWEYVRPLPGHCVVNLGDAMVKFSAGKLISGLHRVVRPPGEQATLERMSLVYFSRPEDDMVLRSLVGGDEDEEALTAKEWILRRALGNRGIGKPEYAGGTETVRRPQAVS
jgi:isopenicillin N synthase-like dioxygenase